MQNENQNQDSLSEDSLIDENQEVSDDQSENQPSEGLLNWNAPEFINHKRGKNWFLVAGSIIVLLIIYAIYSQSATMAIVFIVLAGVYYLTHNQEPKMIEIQLTELGIYIDQTFYAYSMINSFWMVYHPPFVQTLNLRLAKTGKKIVIQLDHQDPIMVRNSLAKYLPEIEGEGESRLDAFIRLLRL